MLFVVVDRRAGLFQGDERVQELLVKDLPGDGDLEEAPLLLLPQLKSSGVDLFLLVFIIIG